MTTVGIGETVSVQIGTLTNPTTTQQTSPFQVLLVNAGDFNINTQSAGSLQVATTEAAPIVVATLTPEIAYANQLTTYSFIFTTVHSIPIGGAIIIYYPSQINIDIAQYSCLVNLTVSPNCITPDTTKRMLTVSNLGDAVAAGTSINVTVVGLINTLYASATHTFIAETRTSASGFKIDQRNQGMTVRAFCDYPCRTCPSTATTQCLTCFTNWYLQDSSCVQQCSEGKILNNGICESCDASCVACSVSATTCTKCGKDGFLFLNPLNNQCTNTCPDGYYGNTQDNKCELCDTTKCLTCKDSPTICTSCVSSKFLVGDACLGGCPALTTILDGNKCIPCNLNCKYCAGTINTCTACEANKKLNLGTSTCMSVCPNQTTILINNQCHPCNANCVHCAGSTATCMSCQAGQVLRSDFTCGPDCGTTAEVPVGAKCEACNPKCSACTQTINKCTACATDYYLYSNTCLDACPSRFAPNLAGQCVLEGLECPLGYIVNAAGTGCQPTNFTCEHGYELNKSKTACIPSPGSIVPFPFFFIGFCLLLIDIGGRIKDKKKSKFVTSLICLWAMLEPLMYLVIISYSVDVTRYSITACSVFALIMHIVSNIAMFVYFKKVISKDNDFEAWARVFRKTSFVVPILVLFWNFKLVKFLYSGFFGLESCMVQMEKPYTNFFRPMRLVTLFSFIFVYIPINVGAAIGLALVPWGYQLLITCIEVLIFSLAILILTCIEFRDAKTLISGPNSYLRVDAKMFDMVGNASEAEWDKYHGDGDEYEIQLRKRALIHILDKVKYNKVAECKMMNSKKNGLRRAFSLEEIHEESGSCMGDSEDEDYGMNSPA